MKKASDYPAKKMYIAKSRFYRSYRLLLPIIPICLLIFSRCGGGGGGGGSTSTPDADPIVTSVVATSVDENNATLNGSVNPNGLPTQAWFKYGTNPGLQTYSSSQKQDIGNGIDTLVVSTNLSSLAPGTTYYFRVCAENSAGYSEGQITNFTTASPGSPPAVTTIAATSVGATEATMNGNVTPNGQATTAWFEWGTSSGLSTYSTTLSQSVGSGTTSQPVSAGLAGLSTGVTYYFRVAANNSLGTIKGSILSFIPGAAAPAATTTHATSVGLTTATLNGNLTANNLPTTAWFEWGPDPALSTFSSTSSVSVGSGAISQPVTADLTQLSTGTTYYFRIAASNSAGTTKGSILSLTAAKPWGTPVQIDSGVGGAAGQAQLAMDAAGNAVAVWLQEGGANYDVWANRYNASTDTWGTPTLIETNAERAEWARIAMDSSGNAVAVWAQGVGAPGLTPYQFNIWSNRYNASTDTWGTAVLVETDSQWVAIRPEVAMDASGNAMVVWQQDDGTVQNMWVNRYNASTGTWGTALLLETNPGKAEAPHVAMDASGNAVAVWPQSDGTYSRVWANHFIASTGTWGTAMLIETGTGGAIIPKVAMNGSGNAMAVWDTGDTVWANYYTGPFGPWGIAVQIHPGPVSGGGSTQVAMDSSGNAVVVWRGVWANRYTASTGTWGTSVQIGPGGGFGYADRNVAMDSSGNAVVVWTQSDGTRSNIWATRYIPSTGTWYAPVLIETDDRGGAGGAQVAVDAAGNAVAVWTQSDGTRNGIWANVYR